MDVGVDVGGTFTDFVGFYRDHVVTLKLPTTRDLAEAVGQGIRALGAQGMAHGTTVATNAILERRGARTAFVTTADSRTCSPSAVRIGPPCKTCGSRARSRRSPAPGRFAR